MPDYFMYIRLESVHSQNEVSFRITKPASRLLLSAGVHLTLKLIQLLT